MANEYAALADLKALRRITGSGQDDELQAKLTAASRAIDRRTGRRFYLDGSASARVFNPASRVTPDGLLLVDDIGATAGLVVEVGSGSSWTTVDDTSYETAPENAIARGVAITGLLSPTGWPGGPTTRVRVTAQWGWPAVPDDIEAATLLLANRLYLRKDSPEGVAGGGEWGPLRVSRWDPDVEVLVEPFILPGFA